VSADSPSHSLPEKPNLAHLKHQAKDLLRAGGATSLALAQRAIAQRYGFASWAKLKAHVEALGEIGRLKEAITANDLDRVRAMMTRDPALHRAPLGYGDSGPLTWAAECRGAPPTAERLAIARWMIENGSDVHQGGDAPLMRAALFDERIPMMDLLFERGADVNARFDSDYPILCAPCETLQPLALRWLLDHGADPRATSETFGDCVQIIISTYCRNPAGKHACLEAFADFGLSLPDTAPMAIHRGRVDLLEACCLREPAAMGRHFSESEIYPLEPGIKPGDGLHCAPLDGATLLHMAAEYHEIEIAQWLLDHGADPNGRAAVDADGFGGHTPLFHTTVTLVVKTDAMARLLLARGANPNARATLRKALRWNGDPDRERMREFHDVTAVGFARQFQQPAWINEAAIAAIVAAGGE